MAARLSHAMGGSSSVYLSHVHVLNFRNLVDVKAEFKPGLNILLGENNVGKSNLLDAIRAALNSSATGGDFVSITQDDRHRDAQGKFVDAPVRVALSFAGLSHDEQAEFLDALNYDIATPANSTATIQCEWSLSGSGNRWSYRRWGSARREAEGAIADEAIQGIPVTFLDALRDAGRALSPGRQSRLARLLGTAAGAADRERVERISAVANRRLQRTGIVKTAEAGIGRILKDAAGTELLRDAVVRAAPNDFDRVMQSLRVLLRPDGATLEDDSAVEDLSTNGLGYNNLIYIATVLAELEARRDATLPLLLLEEPEAHLHPQLQVLLASYLAVHGTQPEDGVATSSTASADAAEATATVLKRRPIQSIITSHSPTVAAHVAPSHLAIMHRGVDSATAPPRKATWVTRIDSCGLDKPQLAQLRRLLDVTKASILFAQGIVLVEGISEVMLLPVLARCLGIDLEKRGVSVVPVGGVDFATIARLFGANRLRTPLAVVTDADPKVRTTGDDWRTAEPDRDPVTQKAIRSPRAESLSMAFNGLSEPLVRISELTLEYDLAAAGEGNCLTMFDAWASLYARQPVNVKRTDLEALKTKEERALHLWRGVCCGSPSHGKAELAQQLASRLDTDKATSSSFVVPRYIEEAIRHAARMPRPAP